MACCPQVVLAMKRGRRDGRPLQYAAARAALWLLNDLPARLETLLFPDNVRKPVSAELRVCMSCQAAFSRQNLPVPRAQAS